MVSCQIFLLVYSSFFSFLSAFDILLALHKFHCIKGRVAADYRDLWLPACSDQECTAQGAIVL